MRTILNGCVVHLNSVSEDNHHYGHDPIFIQQEIQPLFRDVEMQNAERWNTIRNSEIGEICGSHMKAIVPTNDDCSPMSNELKEVFHVD